MESLNAFLHKFINMKKIAFVMLACLWSTLSLAQEKKNSSLIFKVYNQMSYSKTLVEFENINYNDNIRENKTLDFFQPSFAIQFKTTDYNFHEFELSELRFINNKYEETERDSIYTNVLNGNNSTSFRFAMRYEYTYLSKDLSNKKNEFRISYGVQPYTIMNNSSNYLSTIFPEKELYIGLRGMVTPRYIRHINEQLSLDINIPINFVDVHYYSLKINNPTLEPWQSNTQSVVFTGMPLLLNLRIGLAYRI